jgi:hypothetical protein
MIAFGDEEGPKLRGGKEFVGAREGADGLKSLLYGVSEELSLAVIRYFVSGDDLPTGGYNADERISAGHD